MGNIHQGNKAAHLVGMPLEHVETFKQAAVQMQCVLSSRQLGRVCTSLIREGYSTKGFRIKSKSCDFGPMAGFVCHDPRFHKKGPGHDKKQLEDIEHAIHGDAWDGTGEWKASTQQICLTDDRLHELIHWPLDDRDFSNARIYPMHYSSNWKAGSISFGGRIMTYLLHRERRNGNQVWALYETQHNIPELDRKFKISFMFDTIIGSKLPTWELERLKAKPVLALTNPYPPYPRGHYKNACTGDYDLFGVWPKYSDFDIYGEDCRVGGMVPGMAAGSQRRRNDQIIRSEDQRVGNISDRIALAAGTINSLVPPVKGGAPTGCSSNIVNHSDEAGRPFVKDIEDHVIAFVPLAGNEVLVLGMESPEEKNGSRNPKAVQQWKAFIEICHVAGYQVIANAGWMGFMRELRVDRLITTGAAQGLSNYSGRINRIQAQNDLHGGGA